jgi:2-polyprenyl-6-methoxyphenol hydroxylase-like FAD-dependent oxidoreductase
LAARVLADRADRVVVVERDDLPPDAAVRKGVPQGRHAHGLLTAGERVLVAMFPGLMEELVADGAQRVQTTTGRWFQAGGYRAGAPGAPDATFCSRPFLEHAVRARVLARPNVTFVAAAAKGLESDGRRVRGVTVDDGRGPWTIESDLVVDTSGRGSQAPRWLEALGYAPPPVDEVRIDMAYSTVLLTRTPGRLPDRTWFVTISEPPAKRFGVAFPIEGDRWIVTLGGCHRDHPPTDAEGLLAFARSLPATDIPDLLEAETAIAPIVPHRLPSNQWRRYDKVRRHPAGFLALGDSICSFNPVYGQGMSSAAQQAEALAAALDASDAGPADAELWRAFYRRARKVIANPWAIAAGADFVHAETTGPKPPGTDLVNRYVARAIVAAQRDDAVSEAMWSVQGLVAPPPSLMRPAIAWRVLRHGRRAPREDTAPATAGSAVAATTVP